MSTAIPVKKAKSLVKSSCKEVRTIETSLVNKDEVFRMLALAEATNLPLLLIGNPGVAKTKTVIDFAKGRVQHGVDRNNTKAWEEANRNFLNTIYILETDEGTKASEVKGMPDMEELFTKNKYKLLTPITDADFVVINEVDKASSNIRNSLLGVMNERFLFNGKYKIPCKWKLFVATCNGIPKEEVGNPFWDRFVLKMKVSRITSGELSKYFNNGARDYREWVKVGIPTRAEMNAVTIPSDKLEKFLEVCYSQCSDRTLTYVPGLAKAISFIWNVSIDKALIKVAELMVSTKAASDLQDKLLSPQMKVLTGKVEMLYTAKTADAQKTLIDDINATIKNYASTGQVGQSDIDELETSINYIIDNVVLQDDQDLAVAAEQDDEEFVEMD
jgi:hypothetical protein